MSHPLDKLLPSTTAGILDQTDFAAIGNLGLSRLNGLIAEIGHELYEPAENLSDSARIVISLINLGYMSQSRIYDGDRQYA
jgi:hypothetical protein